jgi:hypothetical protein
VATALAWKLFTETVLASVLLDTIRILFKTARLVRFVLKVLREISVKGAR